MSELKRTLAELGIRIVAGVPQRSENRRSMFSGPFHLPTCSSLWRRDCDCGTPPPGTMTKSKLGGKK